MSAYMIVRARVSDWEKFGDYAAAMPAAIAAAGGSYLVLGGSPAWLEGVSDESSVVVSAWPDRNAANAFWHSAVYADIRKLREGCGEFEVILVDGMEASA